jgi:hypothetical protein
MAIALTLLLTPILMIVFYRIFLRVPVAVRIQHTERKLK